LTRGAWMACVARRWSRLAFEVFLLGTAIAVANCSNSAGGLVTGSHKDSSALDLSFSDMSLRAMSGARHRREV